jgi:hypothetical protein
VIEHGRTEPSISVKVAFQHPECRAPNSMSMTRSPHTSDRVSLGSIYSNHNAIERPVSKESFKQTSTKFTYKHHAQPKSPIIDLVGGSLDSQHVTHKNKPQGVIHIFLLEDKKAIQTHKALSHHDCHDMLLRWLTWLLLRSVFLF